MVSVSVRIAAANGDGIESSGTLLAKAAARKGLHIFGYRGYQSVIRGGHVWFSVRIADEKIYDHGETIDILVALNQDAVDHQASHLSKNAFVIYDVQTKPHAPCRMQNSPAFHYTERGQGRLI